MASLLLDELDYMTVSTVLDNWELVRRKENYAQQLGNSLFKKFFKKAPSAKEVFGFDKLKMASDDDFYQSRPFVAHAKAFVHILDKAFDMLGPNVDMLRSILLDVGETHRSKKKVKPEYFPVLGECLLECLEETLGPKIFSEKAKQCWTNVYQALAQVMVAGGGSTTKKKENEGDGDDDGESKTAKDSTKATTDERKISPEPPTSPVSTSTATTLASSGSAVEWEDALDLDTALLLNELSMEKSEFVIKKINRIAKRSTSLSQTVAYATKEIKREHWRSSSQSSPSASFNDDEASMASTITSRSSSIRNSSLSGIRNKLSKVVLPQ